MNNNNNNNGFETPGRGRGDQATGNAPDITPETLQLNEFGTQVMSLTMRTMAQIEAGGVTPQQGIEIIRNNTTIYGFMSESKRLKSQRDLNVDTNKSQRDLNVDTNQSKADLVKAEKEFAEVFTKMKEYQASAYKASNYNNKKADEEAQKEE